jgi:hypothetical protein
MPVDPFALSTPTSMETPSMRLQKASAALL